MMHPILADAIVVGSGSGLIHSLLSLLIIVVCCAIVWWLGNWCITQLGLPAIAAKIWTGIFVFLAAIAAINFLLGISGHPLFVL